MLKVLGLHFHGLTSYGQLNSFGAAREKKSILGSILGHDALFFFCGTGARHEILHTIL